MSQSDYLQPMYFEAVTDGLTISLPYNTIEYRIGIDGEWQILSNDESTPPVVAGTKVFFKKESKGSLGTFQTNLPFKLGGDCRSILYGDKVLKDSPLHESCFDSLFQQTKVTEVEDDFLPATTSPNKCYDGMFSDCLELTKAPALPATTLSAFCYSHMFRNCVSLTKAPELPAETLTYMCYSGMFSGCVNLNYIKMLSTNVAYGLSSWVSNVSPTGTFVKNPEATWDVRGDSGVPNGWTIKFDGEE